MSCPRCGAGSQPDQMFCTKCGAVLGTPDNPQRASVAGLVSSVPQPAVPAPQPQPAPMRPIPDGGLTVEEVSAWLESEGYTAKIVTGESGNRHILTNSQGSPLNIFLGDCKGERCASLELAAGFSTGGKFDISQINDLELRQPLVPGLLRRCQRPMAQDEYRSLARRHV